MTETARGLGSYDDLPESEVATVLEVPLLWSQNRAAAPAPPVAAPAPAPRRRSPGHPGAAGRHRAVPPRQESAAAEPLVRSLQVGVISAAIVLAACAAVLFAVATWLP